MNSTIAATRAIAAQTAFSELHKSHARQLRELAARVELELDHMATEHHCLLIAERDALIAGACALETKEAS